MFVALEYRSSMTGTRPAARSIVRNYGGIIGSIIGGVLSYGGVLLISEKMESNRSIAGFWLRYRGSFISFLAAVGCVIAGQVVFGELIGIVGGFVVGQFVGDAIGEKLDWGGSALEGQLEFRNAYVCVLASAANADGLVSEKEKRLIRSTAKELFSSLGFGDDADISPIVEHAIGNPIGAYDAGGYVKGLTPEFQHYIFLDLCKVPFADGEMTQDENNWLTQFQQKAQIRSRLIRQSGVLPSFTNLAILRCLDRDDSLAVTTELFASLFPCFPGIVLLTCHVGT